MARWIAICAKPFKEDALYRRLQAEGFEIFFPRYLSKTGNLSVLKIKPYFPGYMFVKVDLKKVGISTFQWMPHAVGPVYCGGKPAYVPEALIQAIEKRVNLINSSIGSSIGSIERNDLNSQVEVENRDFDTLFNDHLSGEERVRALLQLLEENISVA